MNNGMTVATGSPVTDTKALPQELRNSMYPDETIVWMQRGRGVRWPLVYTAPPILFAFMITFFVWLMIGGSDGAAGLDAIILFGTSLLAFLCVIVAAAAGIIFGPGSEYYVLTRERVIHHRSFPTRSTRFLAHHDTGPGADLDITQIDVWGRRDAGWIMLRPDAYRARPFRFGLFPHYVTGLVGVENPLEVAALIKLTLALDYEIEDHTR